ncbi:S15 peptidase family protein [Mycolicibacterium poriferae]|uniref:S15 peptidase family protein n=1 Tax=Mycolicibacterium poriferae TaxID=39694 RepID=UPI0024BBCE94|nr:CocE/NonD family hydrolase [Mycolicibacterium poriferae]
MAAGAFVGRVGGLAVALGIGAALCAGQGVALADEGASSASESSASSSSAGPSAESGSAADSSAGDESDAEADSNQADDAAPDEDVDDAEDVEDVEDVEVDEDLGIDDIDDIDEDDSDYGDAPGEEPAVDDDPAVDESAPVDIDEPAVDLDVDADEPAEDPVEESPTAEVVQPVADESVTEPEPQPADEPAEEPDVVTAELNPVDLDQTADDVDGPALPTLASLVMSIVGAGREATNETPQTVGDVVTTSLVEADAAEQYPIPTDVVVEQWTPPLQWLQNIPVLGPLVVTPLVGLAHVIPFVGDILNPVIGFPIDHWAPEGTPQARSFRVTSFDGTRIFVHFMPAEGLQAGESAPTVLNGPGLGLPGATTLELDVDSFLPRDVVGIGALRDAGYNVVTWDPRGEWRSEGILTLDSPDYEGRDMSHIISYLATLPEVALDGVNDPRIGMTGASYGGGIQLATAAIDHRVDAIVPTIAWNSLVDVLFPRGAVNSGWGTILPGVLALTFAREHPRIFPVAIQGVLFGIAEDSDIELVNDLGFQDQIGDITAPTLLIQGTVDTLFTLDQAHTNALTLIEAGTTTKVVWYCGGHGACLSDYNDGEVVIDRTLRWLDRYVKGDESVDTGAQFEWVDQNGEWYSAEQYPVTQGTPVVAERTDRRTIPFVPLLGGSGPNPLILTRGLIATLLGLPSAAGAINAVSLRVPDVTELTHIVGAPEITLTYSGDGNAEHVYAQIVDDRTGLVLGNHATPIPVVLDGETRTVTFSMEQVAHTLAPGQSVTVQIVTSSAKFLNFYSWGAITVEGMSVSLPTRAAEESATVAA